VTNFSSTGPSTGDLLYRGNNGWIGIKEGTAATKPRGWAIINYTYLTDKQSLSVVLGDQGLFAEARTYLYTHSDTGHTEGVYCAVNKDGIELGTYTRSGSTYTYTSWVDGSVDVPLKRGDAIEIRNTGTATTDWFVLVNNVALVLQPEVTGVEYDASHRSAMISMERKNSSTPLGIHPAGDYESFRIASLVMFDYVIPATVGSGAFVRQKNTASNSGASGDNLWPQNLFDTIENTTADIAVSIPEDGDAQFTILIKGWYEVIIRHMNVIADGVAGTARVSHLLYVNGSVHDVGSSMTSGHNGTTVMWQDGLQSTFTVYLEPGDIVSPGYRSTAAISGLFKGEITGKENYCSVALMTRNLL